MENHLSICAAKDGFAGALWMGHESSHVAALVADTGDVQDRAVGVGFLREFAQGAAILPKDLIVGLQFCQRRFVGEIAAFAVGDGNPERLAGRNLAGEG